MTCDTWLKEKKNKLFSQNLYGCFFVLCYYLHLLRDLVSPVCGLFSLYFIFPSWAMNCSPLVLFIVSPYPVQSQFFVCQLSIHFSSFVCPLPVLSAILLPPSVCGPLPASLYIREAGPTDSSQGTTGLAYRAGQAVILS